MAPSSSRAASMIVLLLLPSVILSADAYVTNAADVKLRACDTEHGCRPSTTCCSIIKTLPKGTTVNILCKGSGQSIFGDPYWLYVKVGSAYGWIADYYVSCGGTCPGGPCH